MEYLMGAFQPYLQGAENFWTLPKYGEIFFWGDKTMQVKERKPKEYFISKYVICIQFTGEIMKKLDEENSIAIETFCGMRT